MFFCVLRCCVFFLFDLLVRVDEWREPSGEALAGGRGMFCILPIVKALVEVASHSVRTLFSTSIYVSIYWHRYYYYYFIYLF
ncbi:unnamed protein product [Spirodela intermedia]|uniref:Uncharacterized protein n=1 Tax=Spirodela intermedia TaxID=51605 RepID=A0A7I8J1I4_SPIIN|nr:unnamed protein product [Spirodela intermedia]CAA6663919.1 unnamed protein product [Spirodela intermedia]